ncbi:hypothetical protein [Hydrogenophaga sp. 5NK40-0174]|uniref:hypothetical protein n=1 Tax=Hydrogenophaga sp. 5NK40-0174 TaxID=3127649 RepID=UPI003104235D
MKMVELKVCPKCGYERKVQELVPAYECPQCGIVYGKYRSPAKQERQQAVAQEGSAKSQRLSRPREKGQHPSRGDSLASEIGGALAGKPRLTTVHRVVFGALLVWAVYLALEALFWFGLLSWHVGSVWGSLSSDAAQADIPGMVRNAPSLKRLSIATILVLTSRALLMLAAVYLLRGRVLGTQLLKLYTVISFIGALASMKAFLLWLPVFFLAVYTHRLRKKGVLYMPSVAPGAKPQPSPER